MTEANTIDLTAGDEFPYPVGRVVAIVDTVEQLSAVVKGLVESGFISSEIDIVHGESAADSLASGTGRSGFANVAMKLAAKVGLPNDEMALRRCYEEALRTGHFLVAVTTPTQERKVLASQVILDNGGSFIHYFGERTFEVMSA